MLLKTALPALIAIANANMLRERKEAHDFLSSQIKNRERRANSGLFEEIGASNYQKECIEERCDFQEFQEAKENDGDFTLEDMKVKWEALQKACADSQCDSRGTAACYQEWNKYECVCKHDVERDVGDIDATYILEIMEQSKKLKENENAIEAGNAQPNSDIKSYAKFEGPNCQENVNECVRGFHDCNEAAGQICDNVVANAQNPKGYVCRCEAGKALNDEGICDWFNECEDPNICNNKPGSACVDEDSAIGFNCICTGGYETITDSITHDESCSDIDECEMDAPCDGDPFATCNNLPGSYECNCVSGYAKVGSGDTGAVCTNINECDANADICGNHGTCIDQIPGFICQCHKGYELNSSRSDSSEQCVNIDECSAEVNPCGIHACIDLAGEDGGFRCEPLNPKAFRCEGQFCSDINECDEFSHECGANTVCENNDGGYTCNCNAGFIPDVNLANTCVDKDECATGELTCPTNEVCVNNEGSAACICTESIFFRDSEGNCQDIDECAVEGVGCTDANAVCNNIIGGVDCSVCKSGFDNIAGVCEDIDECASLLACTQDTDMECSNTLGSFTCICRDGYFLNSDELCEPISSGVDLEPKEARREEEVDNGGCETGYEDDLEDYYPTIKPLESGEDSGYDYDDDEDYDYNNEDSEKLLKKSQ